MLFLRFFWAYALGATLGVIFGSFLAWPDVYWFFSLSVWIAAMSASALMAYFDLKEWKRNGSSYTD